MIRKYIFLFGALTYLGILTCTDQGSGSKEKLSLLSYNSMISALEKAETETVKIPPKKKKESKLLIDAIENHFTPEDNPQAIEQLLKTNADPNYGIHNSLKTPLIVAAQYSLPTEFPIDALVKAKADINGKNSVEETPLIIAAKAGHDSTVQYLLSYGANPHLTDYNGLTALKIARQHKARKEPLQALKEEHDKAHTLLKKYLEESDLMNLEKTIREYDGLLSPTKVLKDINLRTLVTPKSERKDANNCRKIMGLYKHLIHQRYRLVNQKKSGSNPFYRYDYAFNSIFTIEHIEGRIEFLEDKLSIDEEKRDSNLEKANKYMQRPGPLW